MMKTAKRIKTTDLPNFDAAPYVDSEEAIAAYLTDILEANDAALLAAALGDIARARGMSEIAKASGITREALYKALRPDAEPRFDTVNRVCIALGVKLVAKANVPTTKSKVGDVRELKGLVSTLGKKVSVRDMNAAIRRRSAGL
jgi:probable addiction module antidote protein